jgi:hypothetical protein
MTAGATADDKKVLRFPTAEATAAGERFGLRSGLT